MAWSKYQNAIFEYAINPDNGSFVVSAVAGSGKTTTCIECAKRLASANPEHNILFLAFNKSVAEKLKEETAGLNMKCATLHSFGLSVLTRSKLKFIINDNKWKNYIKSNVMRYLNNKTLDEKKIWSFQFNCIDLLRLCRISLIDGSNIQDIIDQSVMHGINCVANEVETVQKLLKVAKNLFNFKKPNGIEIDYTDMLCLPLTDSFRKFIFKYDIVFIDEAQDLSIAQQELMLNCVKKDGKFIAVGDPSQSINGFAGSDINSFDRLFEKAGKKLPLSVNYRCGKNIIAEAQKIVKEIQPYDDAEDGEVITQKNLNGIAAGDMIICRKTAPLITVTLNMMSRGVSCFIKGRDIAEGMKKLILSVYDQNTNAISNTALFSQLDNKLDNTLNDLKYNGITTPYAHPTYIALKDKIDAIQTISKSCESPGDIISLLDKIFTDTINGDAIMLSTVHKAKGLEADNVYIICPDSLPMKFEKQQEWEYAQEMNLKYVAVTRAKKKLVFVDVPEERLFML